MSVLSAAQAAATYIGMDVPSALMASTEREHVELREVMKEASKIVAFDSGHDWSALLTKHEFTGDGSTEAYALPTDFRRWPIAQQIWTTRLVAPLSLVQGIDAWNEIETRDYGYTSGVWIRIGDNINIKPAPATDETVSYYYITNAIWSPASGNDAAEPTLDTDSFVLDERLLKLCAVWMWRSLKGLDYAEEMAVYQEATQARIMDEKPTRIISTRRSRRIGGARIAYPQSIT